MKNIRMLTILSLGMMLCSCASKNKEALNETPASGKELLRSNLKKTMHEGVMFGHHDDPLYGIGWEFKDGRSDVKEVCGDYPAVMSFDLGHLELGRTHSLDSVPFDIIRKEIINQYNRGGLVSLSWHADNPLTGGDSWDVSDDTVVASILPGGPNYDKFQEWLSFVNNFILSLKTTEGIPVPVLFRPWHEHTGSWFWWGEKLCSVDQYKALWKMTTDYLKENGASEQIIYAYSPGIEPRDTAEYMERYPGDDIVDVMGFDGYRREDKNLYLEEMGRNLAIIDSLRQTHDKITAITETGYEAVPDSAWWTQTLLPLATRYPLSYVLVWRNAREKENHYFAPYPGQVSAANFKQFYGDAKTLFSADVDLYKDKNNKLNK